MKKLFLALTVVLFAVTAVAQTGLTCEDPIPVDKNYEGWVDGPCTLWYTASTYDLPLNVHFIPATDNSSWSPDVVIDLTCTPGVYADSKVDSIIRMAEGFDISFPIELMCDRVVNDNGSVEWDLFVDAMYREQLAEFGVTYNVPAYVQVTFYEAGIVTLKPDTLFSSCMENTEHVVLDDSITVVSNDSDRVFMMPYTDWQNDSIQFVWTGTEPAYIYMAESKCDFKPELSNSGYVWARYTVQPGVPYRVSNQNIVDAITNYSGGGLFYSKVLSASTGKLVVEKIPLAKAEGGAVLLEYGVSVQLVANDTNTLFCFPKSWSATEFVSTSRKPISIYFSNIAEFGVQPADVNVLAYYDFSSVGDQYELSLSSKEMGVIVDEATDDYIYVRFCSKVATTITAYEWNASDCADKSTMIVSGKTMRIAKKSANNILRLRYDDWQGYDIVLNWSGNSTLPTYIADTCAFTLSSSNARVVYYKSVSKKSVYTISAETIDSWADRVDSDGFFYVRLNPTNQGSLTITSARPEPVPESPCVENSIELKVGDEITLNLDSAFTIYRINYAEWAKQNVTFQWSGEEALHTFVAETCEFAVAPYNRYVVNYIPVSANGNFVLDVATLATFADKVDNAGYLYIRFLTEKEGTLLVSSY